MVRRRHRSPPPRTRWCERPRRHGEHARPDPRRTLAPFVMSERLAVYVDGLFGRGGQAGAPRVTTNFEGYPFLLFACEVGRHADALVFLGRHAPPERGLDFELPARAELVPLPYYPSQRDLVAVIRSVPGTLARMWRALAHVDTLWIFGPYPFSVALAVMAMLRRRRAVLGVRQDTMAYFRSRLPGRWATPLLAPLWFTDQAYRLLSRRLPTTVVGPWLEERYGGPRKGLLAMTVSLIRRHDVALAPAERDWSGPVELLAVGRVEPEKNPALLVDAMAELERSAPGRYVLTWAGDGRLVAAMRERAARLGLSERVRFVGYVPVGEALARLYARTHMFVHVSLTEGMPQVLVEAAAFGLPIVATDVGGVAAGIGREAALLVPPRDRPALVRAIRRMDADEELRRGCAASAVRFARATTIEAESARVACFVLGAGTREGR
jgi:glycosyltransferase involved in cell wall biosynthesis